MLAVVGLLKHAPANTCRFLRGHFASKTKEAASPSDILQRIWLLFGPGDDPTGRVRFEKRKRKAVWFLNLWRHARFCLQNTTCLTMFQFSSRYGPEIDLWALGVTTYSLCGAEFVKGVLVDVFIFSMIVYLCWGFAVPCPFWVRVEKIW